MKGADGGGGGVCCCCCVVVAGCWRCHGQDRLQRILAFLVLILINVQGGVIQKNTNVLEQRN